MSRICFVFCTSHSLALWKRSFRLLFWCTVYIYRQTRNIIIIIIITRLMSKMVFVSCVCVWNIFEVVQIVFLFLSCFVVESRTFFSPVVIITQIHEEMNTSFDLIWFFLARSLALTLYRDIERINRFDWIRHVTHNIMAMK